jgi:pyruvate formate lyase activating enzyme
VNGRIVDIKKFTVHDGPGIRTTVFLKGCSLACRWCHNPESISPNPQIGWFKNKCVGCGACAETCPNNVYTLVNGELKRDTKRCNYCGKCTAKCMYDALVSYGYKMSVDELVSIVLEDKTFYKNSNGGVTISGGEPLLQAKFCADLLKALKAEKINCAIDTCGAVNWSALEAVLPYADLFLYDLKHVNDKLHKEYTGSSNRKILENLSRLSELQVPIEIRIPLIPGFNDDNASIDTIGEFLGKLNGIKTVKVLEYHDLAHSKYKALNIPYKMLQVSKPSIDKLNRVTARLASYKLDIIDEH